MRTGVYYYRHAYEVYPVLRLQSMTMRVNVISEKGNRYYVMYMGLHANGSPPGSCHWVRKSNVRVDPPPVSPDNIRLPYKD